MTRVLPVVLAVLLALAPPAVAFETGSTTSMSAETDVEEIVEPPGFNNTTSQLSLGTPNRAETSMASMSLSASLEMDRNEVRTQKRMYILNERLSNAENNQVKEQALRRYRYEIGSQLSSLKYTERNIRKKFNDGRLSGSEYVRRLAVLHARAENIDQSIAHMKARGSNVPRFTPEVWTLRGNLIPLQGKVRQYAVNQYRGESEPRMIYVATTKTGVALSTVHGNQYVREAYLGKNKDTNGTNQLLGQKAQNITAKQYPWAKNHSNGELSTNSRYGTGIFMTTLPHEHGVIKTVLDGRTEKIFRETQFKSLTGATHIPYGHPIRNETANLELTVNRTYVGGPLRVNVTDGNGKPVTGQISIGETEIGTAGSDGVLWTIAPRRTVTVSARYESTTVNATFTPYGLARSNTTTGPPQSIPIPSER
ncbi:DUF7094 domain-containing protein [Haladaptatus caseinilyticus]|uniref:DUF7094 domain-containing protein n=1 Tax=Haladaptatus caseinilyticus TaxID=2993314 RepID=UPI00224B4038|nr:hypothetical protein [Haladaptatus caseinilyticus]